jgi:nitrate/TMAO reductase-like tetraheme cytochrome c subunit
MNKQPPDPTPDPDSWIQSMRNWVSLAGLILVVASVFSFLFLFLIDTMAGSPNPYIGILTYLVTPAFSTLGVIITIVGVVMQRRRLIKARGAPINLVIDFNRPRHRKILAIFGVCSVTFLFISALGTYQSYQFTESVTFCGQACHTVMEPEMVTYQNSPHARVACVDCHIGPGATWFVRSKLSGMHQVFATLFDTFPRPVPTPIKNLRPARDTCEQCHWPDKFSGDIVRTYNHFLTDEENTPFTVQMLLKVGGGHPDQGPVEGIHWHTSPNHKVEYIATDDLRLEIPWVRLTDEDGTIHEFRTPEFTEDISGHTIRTMDCIDCHNRPSHRYETPNAAVDRALFLGRLDRSMPYIRLNATEALVQPYDSVEQALREIAASLHAEYPEDPRAETAIQVVQQIYRQNFFPNMKADWRAYPEHIGHMDWPGCVRCHDDNHFTADGSRSITFQDCNSCHLILAQGQGEELFQVSPAGQSFRHPWDDYDPAFKCHDCHTGGP